MDSLLSDISKKSEYYRSLEATICTNISGRICHHNVRILNAIINQFPIQTYLEIGVHNGTSMSYVVNQPRALVCIGVDLFSDTIHRYSHDKLQEKRTLANIEKSNTSKSKIYLIKGNSKDISTVEKIRSTLNGSTVDLLFIDGDHEFGGVESDFKLYSPLVRKGGYIVFDDANKQYPGILKCIDRYIRGSPDWSILGLYENTDLIVQKL